ncbi:TPA: hypothetical protein GF627_20930 [Escherichia coli]|nr:hypothetical protein [Escherichia coli]HAH3003753.1 hypothetical protein [Escherichia coli]
MQRETVWLVEDEQGIADTLVYMLQQEGFAVEVFERGLPVLDKARQQVPDVMILDVGLPDISGFELCRQLLALHPALPVLFLTARSEEVDRLLGLEIGADDYVAKPFSPREVCARVRTLLRRVKKFSSPSPVIRIGHFELNEPAAQISWFDTPLTLTRYEFLLLKTLLKSPGRVWSRQQLMDSVWEDAQDTYDRTVDTHIKTLLAELARPDLLSGDPTHGQLAQAFNQLQHRPFRANIGGINKVRNEYHVYMTDSQGKVLFDSANKAVGQDYSRWNDVWLTLRGQYGARSTLQNPADPESSVMYVAAPIMDGSRLIGVLSVGKPNAAMAPVIKRSERRILWASAILLGIALVIGAGMVWWINRSIARLTRYADSVTDNKPVPLPELGSSELRKLAQALESMRVKLEGKNYIEQYVYALTHELKSPLAAIRGAAEILREGPPPEVVARFTDNILTQNARMQALVETLLRQARLENRQEVVLTVVDVAALFRRVSEARTVQLAEKNITLHVMPTEVNVAAEPALLEQALGNLLDNAIDFTPESGRITLSAEVDQEHVALKVLDTGSGIPDYALSRIFERFYSLPRANGQKSSGLGLAFVSEVARLFNGEVTLRNVQEGGVLASLRLHRHFT